MFLAAQGVPWKGSLRRACRARTVPRQKGAGKEKLRLASKAHTRPRRPDEKDTRGARSLYGHPRKGAYNPVDSSASTDAGSRCCRGRRRGRGGSR